MPLIDFTPAPCVTDVALGAAGAVYTRGWDREVAFTGAKGSEIKQWIMEAIRPPVDDAEQILAQAQKVYLPIPF